MSSSLNNKLSNIYTVPDETDLDRTKSQIYKDIYAKALAMQHQALVDLIKIEQSSTIYNHVNNPVPGTLNYKPTVPQVQVPNSSETLASTTRHSEVHSLVSEDARWAYNRVSVVSCGTCLISDRKFFIPVGTSTYSIRFPLPRYGDAIQSFEIRLPAGHRVSTARAQLVTEFNGLQTIQYKNCQIHAKPNNPLEYTILSYYELVVIACYNIFLELVCDCDMKDSGSSHAQVSVQLWADYIFYSTNERSKKLFSRVMYR